MQAGETTPMPRLPVRLLRLASLCVSNTGVVVVVVWDISIGILLCASAGAGRFFATPRLTPANIAKWRPRRPDLLACEQMKPLGGTN